MSVDFIIGYLLGALSALGAGAATIVISRALDYRHQRACHRLQLEAIDASVKRAQQHEGVH